MSEIKAKAGHLTDSVTDYVQTSYKLTLLNAADKATTITASTLALIVTAFFGVFVILFGGMALGFWLGSLLNSYALGFLLVALLFTLIILITFVMRKKIVFPLIRDKLINKLYEQNDQNLQ